MTDPTAGERGIVIVGTSGMVGGYALRYTLDNPAVRSVISVGRKKLGLSRGPGNSFRVGQKRVYRYQSLRIRR